jgi:tripartite-type tricarboxylate transporter receptor subunit TctC
MFLDTLTLSTLVRPETKFGVDKFVWIGRVAPASKLAYVWHTAPAKSVQDAVGKGEITISATSPTSTSSMIPLVLNRVLGTSFKPVTGYRGSAAGALAAERGETHGVGAIGLEVLMGRHAGWLRDKKIHLLYTASVKRIKEFPDLPALPDFGKNADDRKLLAALGSGTEIGRALAGEPGIPNARASALRQAFTKMVEDAAFLADAKKRNMAVEPLSGDAVQKIVAEVAATPKPLVDILKEVVRNK